MAWEGSNLQEVFGEVRAGTNRALSECLGMAERVVGELLAEGLVLLSKEGQPVAPEEHGAVLRDLSKWVDWRDDDSPLVTIGLTDAGREVEAEEVRRRPAGHRRLP
jgi:hypothetical protein